jgi:hypothetical protein
MRLVKVSKERRTGYDKQTGHHISRVVPYPPPSTGSNYNLVDNVEPVTEKRSYSCYLEKWQFIHVPMRRKESRVGNNWTHS